VDKAQSKKSKQSLVDEGYSAWGYRRSGSKKKSNRNARGDKKKKKKNIRAASQRRSRAELRNLKSRGGERPKDRKKKKP